MNKKIIIDSAPSAIEYLESMLSNWHSWHDHHENLVKSIQILLKEHKSLTESVRANTVREIQEKIHAEVTVKLAGITLHLPISHITVDRIADQMLEGCATNNLCVSCGEVIPEGRQVCPKCDRSANNE